MNREVAAEVSATMLEISRKLNASLLDVRDRCTPEEFDKYRRGVGVVMSDMLCEILNPLYRQHPDLKPPEMD